MMYHFIFGLRGASPEPAPVEGCGVCSPPASFFSSSCMIKLNSANLRPDLVPEITEQERDALLDDVINYEKIHAKDKDGNHHHGRGRLYFLPRGRGHLARLGAHVVIERLDALRPGLDPFSEIFAGGYDRISHLFCLHSQCFCRNRFPASFQNLAGAEGFEPPSSVLETDSLTVELTPL